MHADWFKTVFLFQNNICGHFQRFSKIGQMDLSENFLKIYEPFWKIFEDTEDCGRQPKKMQTCFEY